jgi:hypothetical protein
MRIAFILPTIIGGLLTSCYFVNDIFDPPEEKKQSLQDLSQESVSNYLKKTTKGETYEPFGFGNLTIHKPEEILELERLEKKFKLNPSIELDSSIARKKRFIQLNKIERTIVLDHFFTLTDSVGKLKIFETNFTLNDTLGVKELSANIMLHLSSKYKDALSYYFYEYNIFNSPSYYESRNLSSNFYAFFKEELEKRDGRVQKTAFLLHALKMTYQVKLRGEFNQQVILEKMVTDYIVAERKDISDYRGLDFSELYQTQNEQEELMGYYFFHKFIGSFQEQLDTSVVLIEFSKFYEIDMIYQMDRPFGTYFKD